MYEFITLPVLYLVNYFIIFLKMEIDPGQDHSWTIGTELRQQKMHEASVSNPQHFRNVLVNDVQRRHYVLDADVVALADPAQIKKGF